MPSLLAAAKDVSCQGKDIIYFLQHLELIKIRHNLLSSNWTTAKFENTSNTSIDEKIHEKIKHFSCDIYPRRQ